MQPNNLEFHPAQEWRTLDMMAAEWKRAMRESHQCELEEVIRAFVDVRIVHSHCCMMSCTLVGVLRVILQCL